MQSARLWFSPEVMFSLKSRMSFTSNATLLRDMDFWVRKISFVRDVRKLQSFIEYCCTCIGVFSVIFFLSHVDPKAHSAYIAFSIY